MMTRSAGIAVAWVLFLIGTVVQPAPAISDESPSRAIDAGISDTFFVAINPKGTLMATARGVPVKLFSTDTWEHIRDLKAEVSGGYEIRDLIFTGDGRIAALGQKDIFVWQADSGKLLTTIPLGEYSTGLAVSVQEDTILTVDRSQTRLWSLSDGALLATLEAPKGSARSAASSPDGTEFITSYEWGKTGHAWASGSGNALRKIPNLARADSMAYSTDGKLIAAVPWIGFEIEGAEGNVHILDAESGDVFTSFKVTGAKALAFTSNGKWLAVGTWKSDGKEYVYLCPTSGGDCIRKLGPIEKPIYSVAFTPDGSSLVAAAKDKFIHVWGLEGNETAPQEDVLADDARTETMPAQDKAGADTTPVKQKPAGSPKPRGPKPAASAPVKPAPPPVDAFEIIRSELSDLKIFVLYGNDDPESAQRLMSDLFHMGYIVDRIGAAEKRHDKTTVYYIPEMQAHAKSLATKIGHGTVAKPVSWKTKFHLIVVTGTGPSSGK